MSHPMLQARNIVKVFDDGTRALDGVSFEAAAGEVLTLLGPSGCGKSTLLRIVAGLEQPSAGELDYDGLSLMGVPAGDRRVGFVFQNYALYPHLTVAGNLGLAMEVRKVPREEREQRIRETAKLLGIGELLKRRPAQLSGGQQQRVALGRALVREPKLYLLDEPLSNLDALLRESMRGELKTLFGRVKAIVLYVTHDQAEAMSLSDRIAVMRAGRIHQIASPLDLYRSPADLFVATFVGSPRMTVWKGRREGGTLVARDVEVPMAPRGGGGEMYVGIRPEDVQVSDQEIPGGLPVRRLVSEPMGSSTLLTLQAGGETVRALVDARDWPEQLWMAWPTDRLHWFDGQSEQRVGGDA